MGIEDEGKRDLSLSDEAAENVAGGTRKKLQKTSHRSTHTSTPASAVAGTSAGLRMGPDPDYPNPDGGADNLD
jgi:hypothetical protein